MTDLRNRILCRAGRVSKAGDKIKLFMLASEVKTIREKPRAPLA